MALPGEFTKRAFINGKMSLTGAEALGDLLESRSDEQIYLARSGMRGALSDSIQRIYDPLCDVLAAIFAKIDYPDEDLADIGSREMLEIATKCLDELKRLSATYSTGKAVNEGVPTAIIGRTNAGKSSLYNRLVGRDAAIVTDIEGTTRDILTETTYLGRVCLLLSDTAGLRDSSDTVEQIGVERARRQAEGADLILAVFDGSREPDEDDIAFISYVESIDAVKVAVINKQDLGQNEEYVRLTKNFDATVAISADSGMGFDSLCDAIEKLYIDRSLDTAKDAIISNARQHAAIINAIDALGGAISAIKNELPLEICCSETERCLQALGEIDGRTVSEDIVSRIFANFCVGK
jgi:tRNA modification GTPase